jgi:hypothetical protein
LTNPRRIEQGEPGNLAFGVHRSTDNPNEFWLYETWVDEAAVQAHESGDAFKQYKETLQPLVEPDSVLFGNPSRSRCWDMARCPPPRRRSSPMRLRACRSHSSTVVSLTAVPIEPARRMVEASGPPERPGTTTHASCTPWRRGSWARPSDGPKVPRGMRLARADATTPAAAWG